ncbi:MULTISPECIES: XTP/dITP diphosphatase [Halanaerobium]|jgi:XTP/dITP diphosphohydrolase|uniref:dITP/XTP pyrophosphatase n=1 Tax=Halanaerobium kushneri TaxID=56779 RepID=A0A1N6U4B2_9FIRM|nr:MULTISPECIES: XTP/dITP diphosphatase [Halanaerobium]PUU94603.1 MAG: dITP/XTP pyrophosphatase [Halanaerobium sp.]RCW60190.1 XTP/dITP diphosphohydrolase [Halanaerobium sp. ST460_2HS_T2]SIQ60478.1 XTP/dITP diphosphohydrolase [Halanaerobium kushneri]
MRKIIIGSGNQHKIEEIKAFFAELDFDFEGLDPELELPDVIEDGKSYKENALKKARQRAKELNEIVLADDSGLSVDYLDGAPGIYSARFGGEDLNDRDKYLKILEILKGQPESNRKAAFVSVIALVDPFKNIEITAEGRCEGLIAEEPAGENGFGYDPIFYLPEYKKTMAQISQEEKNKISHRGRALIKMKRKIKESYN